MSTQLSFLNAYLGIDVAKQKLDIVLTCAERSCSHVFSNSLDGFDALDNWIGQQGIVHVHACLEATGSYSDGIVRFLSEQGYQVSVLNPAVLVAYQQSKNTLRTARVMCASSRFERI